MLNQTIKFLAFSIFLFLLSCSGNNSKTLGGFENLKWGDDISTVKQYLEKNINAEYDYYEMESATGKLKLRFKGSEFQSLPVTAWIFEILKGGLVGYEIIINGSSSINNDYGKLVNYYTTELGRPNSSDNTKSIWKINPSNKKYSEKVVVRKYSGEIKINVEKINGK